MTIEKLSWVRFGKSYKMTSEDERSLLENELAEYGSKSLIAQSEEALELKSTRCEFEPHYG